MDISYLFGQKNSAHMVPLQLMLYNVLHELSVVIWLGSYVCCQMLHVYYVSQITVSANWILIDNNKVRFVTR